MMGSGRPVCFRWEDEKKGGRALHHHLFTLMVIALVATGHINAQNDAVTPNAERVSDVNQPSSLFGDSDTTTETSSSATRFPPLTTTEFNSADETTAYTSEARGEAECNYCNWKLTHREHHHLNDTTGHMQWSEPLQTCSCVHEISWHIKPIQNKLGLVLHFVHFSLKWYESLELHRGDQRTEDSLLFTQANLTTAIQLLPHAEVTVWVRTMPWPFFIVENDPSSFSLNYTTHPVHLMPTSLLDSPEVNRVSPLMAKNYVYDCSSATIPDYIRCDMVQQCAGGEDEPDDCPYRSASCDHPWFLLNQRCLQMVTITSKKPEGSCEKLVGGKLTILPQPATRKLLTMLIARAGISRMCLAVNLNTVHISSSSGTLKDQYRNTLQWAGGVVSHGDPPPRRSTPDSQIALLFSRGDVMIRVMGQVECYKQSVTGLLCMKAGAHSDDGDMNKSQAVKLFTNSSATLSPALRHSTHVLKTCRDGSVVFQFQPCPLEEPGQLQSPNKFKLFDCIQHGQVHYSVLSDGHRDCVDGSDEMGCDFREGRLTKSHFICSDDQTVSPQKRCDGVSDCLDQSDEMSCSTCAEGRVRCDGLGCRPLGYSHFFGCDTSATDEKRSTYEFRAPMADKSENVSDSSIKGNRMDLIIVLQSSLASQRLKAFLTYTLLTIKRSIRNVRVGVILLETVPRWTVTLDQWDAFTETDISDLDYTAYDHGTRGLRRALSNAAREFFPFESSHVVRLMLIVSNASDSGLHKAIDEAEAAKAQGVHILAAGMWNKGSERLSQLVSPPWRENLYIVQTADGITEVLYKIMFAILPYGSLPALVDTDINGELDYLTNAAEWKRLSLAVLKRSAMSTVDGVLSPTGNKVMILQKDSPWSADMLGLFDIYRVDIKADKTQYDAINVMVSETPAQLGKHCRGTRGFEHSSQKHFQECTPPVRGRYVTIVCRPHRWYKCKPQVYEVQVFGIPVHENWEPKYRYPPAVVHLDGTGMSTIQALKEGQDTCPETHFQCSQGFCIPTHLLNNGVTDCPLGDDENIDDLTCPGFYRCVDSGTCLHPDLFCDGVKHCWYNDDERYCGEQRCPQRCVCEGLAFHCMSDFDYQVHDKLRYLSFSGMSNPDLQHIEKLRYLQFLNLSSCELRKATLDSLKNLRILDVSHNNITRLDFLQLKDLPALVQLDLSYNPLWNTLDYMLSDFVDRAGAFKLKSLRMVGVGLEAMASKGLHKLKLLSMLDVRDNPLHALQSEVFGPSLRVLYTDNPKACCGYFHVSKSIECHAPVDELSSCDDLLRSDVLRGLLWFLSTMALTGNAAVWVYRMFGKKQGTSLPYRILVLNLSAADFLMGVYMAIIGVADAIFHGVYVKKEGLWRHSAACKTAGFLAMLSSEMSAFVMCLITVDRLILLRFPYSNRFHSTKLSSSVACSVAWLSAAVLAALPLFQPHWTFYSQNSICLPLPITRHQFPGQQYAFGVFIILNFLLFLVIATGQLIIFHTIRKSSRTVRKDTQKQEVAIARRLFLIVFTDFCCWFPIGLMGLLTASGTRIPNVVNVWAAVFILPLNSALNPFLYTMNTFRDRRAKRRKEKQVDKMMEKLKGDMRTWSTEQAMEINTMWLRAGSVSGRYLMELTGHCHATEEEQGTMGKI